MEPKGKLLSANNEIIRMRAAVRKARVGLIWKLTKQTKLLKNRKHGDEKTLQKCKRKSEKFIREIKAIKSLKDDDITRFAILNTRSLAEVLADPKVIRKTRVLTKLAFHKTLKSAIDKFREKFPDYKLGKRQLTNNKLTQPLGITPPKIHRQNSEDLNEDPEDDIDSESAEDSSESESSFDNSPKNLDESSKPNLRNSNSKSELSTTNEEDIPENPAHTLDLPKTKGKPKEKKLTSQNPETDNSGEKVPPPNSKKMKNEKKIEDSGSKNHDDDSGQSEKPKSNADNSKRLTQIRVVSNLASVKRLKIGELLEERDEISEACDVPSKERKIELNTAEDSFFISGASGGVYKSIVVPRLNPQPLEDDSDNRPRKSFSNGRNSSRSSNHGEESETRKNSRARQNDFGNRRRDYSGKQETWDRRGNTRGDNKFENNRGRDMIATKNCEENLHPSWVARKKQQEVLKQGFQGKKIVFGDD